MQFIFGNRIIDIIASPKGEADNNNFDFWCSSYNCIRICYVNTQYTRITQLNLSDSFVNCKVRYFVIKFNDPGNLMIIKFRRF